MSTYQYSFANVDLLLNFNGDSNTTVSGFPTGENLINCVRRAPVATTQFGAYGDMVVSLQRIEGGDLTFSLLMNAPENKLLQERANEVQTIAHGPGRDLVNRESPLLQPIQASLFDNMGADVCTMTNGVILAMPAMSRGQTMNTVSWTISFEKMIFKRDEWKDSWDVGD